MNQPAAPLPLTPATSSIATSPTRELARIGQSATPALVQAWRLIQARKALILGITALTAAVTILIVFQLTPIYRSAATVLVETNKNKVVSIEEIYSGVSANREYFQTQVDFLRSRDVGLRVIRQLQLADHPEFDPRQNASWLSGLLQRFSSSEDRNSQQYLEARVLSQYLKQLSVTQMRQSQLIEVAFESPDPDLAARVANAVAEQYIRADLDARFEMTQKANTWLNERLGVLKDRLDQSERAVQRYRDDQGIVEGRNTTPGSAGRQLDELGQRLVQAKIARSQAEQIYNQVRSGSPNRFQVPAVFNNPSVARARELETAAEAKLTETAQRVGNQHPQYLAAQNELLNARQNTVRQSEAVVASLAKDYEVAAATERALEDSQARARNSLQAFNRKEIDFDALSREADSNRQIYQTFLSRTKETGAAGDFLTPVARIIDPASVPLNPAKPPKLQLIGIGLLAGLILGLIAASVRERMNDVIRSSSDVQNELHQPMLAALPLLPEGQAQRSSMVQIEQPASLYAESVRTILTEAQLASLDVRKPIFLFTSTLPGEGKSTLAINFALEQARSKRVLLIDMDLRRPTVAEKLGLPRDSRGTTEYLTRREEAARCIYSVESMHLSVMPAGKIRPNAHELLSSPHFAERIRALESQFDVIAIDSPPMQIVSDALLISSICTGLIYVVKSDSTPVPLIRRNLDRLAAGGVHVIGVALNGHDFDRAEKYYGDYSAYTKYGYESAYQSSAGPDKQSTPSS